MVVSQLTKSYAKSILDMVIVLTNAIIDLMNAIFIKTHLL